MKGFAKYKQNIDSILENSYEDKDKFKNNLSVIIGAMKFSKALREFFVLYNEIESKKLECLSPPHIFPSSVRATFLRPQGGYFKSPSCNASSKVYNGDFNTL